MKDPTTFNWLHFSDLHLGTTGISSFWGNIEQALYDDIKYLNLEYDAILFTGDLVNRGKEYGRFNTWLEKLKQHLTGMGCNPLFLAVPGNHDLERPGDDDDAYRTIRRDWDTDEKIRNRIWDKQEKTGTWKLVQSAFKKYTAWWHDKNRPMPVPAGIKDGLLPGDFAYTIETKQYKVGIMGLNMAFLHLSDDCEGKLDIHPKQMVELCGSSYYQWTDSHTACIIMTHHPVSWLSKRGKEAFTKEITIKDRFLLHLCGHLHEEEYTQIQQGFHSPEQRTLQGTSLFSMETFYCEQGTTRREVTDRRHGYSAGQLRFLPGEIIMRIWPRTINKSKEFVPNTDIDLIKGKEYGEIRIKRKNSGGHENGGKGHGDDSSDPDIAGMVKTRINSILVSSSMAGYCTCIIEEIRKEISGKEIIQKEGIAEFLVKKGTLASILLLDKAVRTCKEDLLNELKHDILRGVWDNVVTILGWLVLLTVDSTWIKENKDMLANDYKVIHLELPVETDTGVEVAISGLKKKKADFLKDDQDVRGMTKIPQKICLETGWDHHDAVAMLEKDIYKLIFKKDPPNNFSPKDKEELNLILAYRNQVGNHHYLVVPGALPENDTDRPAIFKQLVSDIPALNIVYLILDENKKVFLVSELALKVAVQEFLRNKPE